MTFAIDRAWGGRSFLSVHRFDKDVFEKNYANKDVITNWQSFQFLGSLVTLDEIDGYYTEADIPRLRSLIEQYGGGVEHFILVGERPGGNGEVIYRESFGQSMGNESKRSQIGVYIQTRRHGYVSGEESGMVVHAPLKFVLGPSFRSKIAKMRAKEERRSQSEGATPPGRLQSLVDLYTSRGAIKTNGYLREIKDLDFLIIFHLDGFEVFNRKGESMRQTVSY